MHRRRAIALAGTCLAGGIAGCIGDNGDGDPDDNERGSGNDETSNEENGIQESNQQRITVLDKNALPGDQWEESDLYLLGIEPPDEMAYEWNGEQQLVITSGRIEHDDAAAAEDAVREFDEGEEVAVADGGYANYTEVVDQVEGENSARCVFRNDSTMGLLVIYEFDGGVDEAPVNVTRDQAVSLANEMY